MAEAQALLQGVQKCVEGGSLLEVESDYLVLVQILTGKVAAPWIEVL